MRAEQFIKDHGLEPARGVVEGAPEGAEFAIDQTFSGFTYLQNINGDEYDEFTKGKWVHVNQFAFNSGCGFGVICIDLRILKRLVESVDLVTKQGGLLWARTHVSLSIARSNYIEAERLKQAIADYESIYGEGNE